MKKAKNPKIVIGKTDKELQHEVFYNPEADEFAMVEGEAKDWAPPRITEKGVLKFLWIVWGIITFLAANVVFGEGGWVPESTFSSFDTFMFYLALISIISVMIWIPFTIYLIAYTAGYPIIFFIGGRRC